jgi:hypothetical protein
VWTTIRPDAPLAGSHAKKIHKKIHENKTQRIDGTLFQSKKYREYQGHRAITPDRAGISMPVLVGSGLIAAAILLSTLITAVGTRFIGMDSPNDDYVWLIDRLTGNVYKCQAAQPGKASCDTETLTGSIGEPGKR